MIYVNGDILRNGMGSGTADTKSMASSFNSGAQRIRDNVGYALHLIWTNTSGPVTGTFKLQASCDEGATPVNWEDISGTSTAVSGAGSQMYNMANQYYAWVRVVYTAGSGVGTLTVAKFIGKGY